MKRKVLTGVVVLAALLGLSLFSTVGVVAKEVVTVYGWSGDWDIWFEDWGRQFEKETGYKLQYVSGGGLEMFSRIVNEQQAPTADVLLSSASYLFQANNMGLTVDIPWDQIPNAAYVADQFKFPSVSVFGYDIFQLAYNYNAVDAANIPKNWKDLADAEWNGKVMMRSPQADLTAWIWFALNEEYGEEKAWEYLLGMFRNSKVWAGTVGEVVQGLSMGEVVVSPASIGHVMLSVQQAGGTIAASVPEVNPVLMLNGLSLIKNAPNTEGAIAFINFFLDTYVQDFIMNVAGTSVAVNSSVELTNQDLVAIGLGGVSLDEVLERAYTPDWLYWTFVEENGNTRLGNLSLEIETRVRGL